MEPASSFPPVEARKRRIQEDPSIGKAAFYQDRHEKFLTVSTKLFMETTVQGTMRLLAERFIRWLQPQESMTLGLQLNSRMEQYSAFGPELPKEEVQNFLRDFLANPLALIQGRLPDELTVQCPALIASVSSVEHMILLKSFNQFFDLLDSRAPPSL